MDKNCTIYKTASFVGKKWTLLILLELYRKKAGWKRYSIIKKGLPGITAKILSQRFSELQDEGLIEHKIDASLVPIRSEYRLTESGIDFMEVLSELKRWALKWKTKNPVCKNTRCFECNI